MEKFKTGNCIEMPRLTDDEKAVLKLLSGKWIYIARDKDDNMISVYIEKPTASYNYFYCERDFECATLEALIHQFESIKQMTCYKISDLLGV